MTNWHPLCTTNCADCGIGTITSGEFYMVKDDVWERAWRGRRKWYHKVYGLDILCIGCLEERIGRVLTKDDFTDAPVNNPVKTKVSDRLFNRLTANQGVIFDNIFDYLNYLRRGMSD
jgi:hypothetical protein